VGTISNLVSLFASRKNARGVRTYCSVKMIQGGWIDTTHPDRTKMSLRGSGKGLKANIKLGLWKEAKWRRTHEYQPFQPIWLSVLNNIIDSEDCVGWVNNKGQVRLEYSTCLIRTLQSIHMDQIAVSKVYGESRPEWQWIWHKALSYHQTQKIANTHGMTKRAICYGKIL